MTGIEEARTAMAAMDAANARLATRTRWPFWRHAAVGVMTGFLVGMQAFDGPVRIAANASVIIAALALIRRDRKADGMFVNGWRRGPTLWVTLVLLAGAIAALFAMLELKPLEQGQIGLYALIVVGVATWGTALSYVWQSMYQRELGVK